MQVERGIYDAVAHPAGERGRDAQLSKTSRDSESRGLPPRIAQQGHTRQMALRLRAAKLATTYLES